MINAHVSEFAGKPVKDWNKGDAADPQFTYRLLVEYEDEATWTDKLAAFLETPGAEQATGLIAGNWGEVASGDDAAELIEALTVARERLPHLTALFVGDITYEESELSWINQSDVSPLFSAYPNLENFRIRGGQGLRFGGLQCPQLKTLIVETGGLPVEALQDIMKAQLPNLEHLELWLGDTNYGWTGSISDLKPLLEGDVFPKLTYLGLRNSEISDEIAAALVNAPVMRHLRTLDLSMGTLSDEGAKALLQCPFLPQLEKLAPAPPLSFRSHDRATDRRTRPGIGCAAAPRRHCRRTDPLGGVGYHRRCQRPAGRRRGRPLRCGWRVTVLSSLNRNVMPLVEGNTALPLTGNAAQFLSDAASASEIIRLPARPFVVVCNPFCPRTGRFQDALARLGLPPAQEIAWTDILAGRVALPDVVPPGAIVRIEAPGTLFAAERALLALGADVPDPEGEYARLPKRDAANMDFDKGRIVCPRQWYLGFQLALERIEQQLAACPHCVRMNHPPDIAVMFDKPRCQQQLRSAHLPTPRPLGVITGYNDLIAKMRQADCGRVFVKLAHGSSASGVIAYRTQGDRHQAVTTVEMARQDGELVLYNTRRIQTYHDPHTISELIDALARHRAWAEEWIPKASMDGHCFDLRVVVIDGRAQHSVARLSHKPMTNLHLRNPRRSWEFAQQHLGMQAAQAALQTCEAALRCFPHNLYTGVDLLFAPGLRRHALLELNAFGDLLPGTLYNGRDTYAAEIVAATEQE